MSAIEIIYCADGNARFAKIAIDAGYTYGAQPLRKFYYPIEFADLHPSAIPARVDYISALAQHRPRLATVADWTTPGQLPDVLAWAEDAAAYVETIIIIPKVLGGIALLPRVIGNKPIRLGYSVPTRHGGTELPVWEFADWPVHLLGGSPQAQSALTHYLNVVSVDGNMAHKMATRYCAFFDPDKITSKGFWPGLKNYDGQKWGNGDNDADAPYEAFRRSCVNIMQMWQYKKELGL